MIQIRATIPEDDTTIILSTAAKTTGVLTFDLLVDEHKDNVVEQFNVLKKYEASTGQVTFNIKELFDEKVSFDDYDTDSVTYTLTVTEHLFRNHVYEALSQLVLIDTSAII